MAQDEELPKGVQFLQIDSLEKVKDLWDKLSSINGLFDDFQKGRSDIFLNKLQSRDTLWLERTDGNGILYLTNIVPNLSATGHVVYWDKRLRGREEFTMDVLRYLMRQIPLVKINLYLPDYARAARAFASRIGFKKEGAIRRWSYSNGRLFDINVYGITQEEAFNGKLHGTKRGDVSSTEHRDGEKLHAEHASTSSGGPSATDGGAGYSDKSASS